MFNFPDNLSDSFVRVALVVNLKTQFMTINGKTIYISVDGEMLIKQAFNKLNIVNPIDKVDDNKTTTIVNQVDDVKLQLMDSLQSRIDSLIEQNRDLREQLNKEREYSREQTDKLSNLVAQFAELSRNSQILLGAEQSRTNSYLLFMEENQQIKRREEDKKGFFNGFLLKNSISKF